jgi:crotonobetainyl-CoA:carnitine CoA-transferase CaiB-like acyl-CoA transferase
MSEGLFEDLLVIDCASFVAGPAAGTIMGDFGARVIKIEPPGGDGYRLLKHLPGLPQSESNYPWEITNRNKESLALDLKQPAGRAILDTLLEQADVFITNYPLPVRERLRLRYQDISAVNPRLIYASLTPYGEQGPEADNTGYDATAWWARSGLMDTVRASADTPPAMSVPAMGDHMAANTLYGGIVTALYRRERTGQGGQVGTSLMGNGLWSNGLYVQAALDGADMSSRLDSNDMSAFTNTYRCRDDRWFMLVILLQAQAKAWPELARCVGHPEWIDDPRFADAEQRQRHNLELKGLLENAFAQRDWKGLEEDFSKYGITCGAIAQAADHVNDEQARAAGMLVEFGDGSGSRTVDSPLYVHGENKRTPQRAPAVGQHSLAILEEFGVDAETAGELQAAGIIGT